MKQEYSHILKKIQSSSCEELIFAFANCTSQELLPPVKNKIIEYSNDYSQPTKNGIATFIEWMGRLYRKEYTVISAKTADSKVTGLEAIMLKERQIIFYEAKSTNLVGSSTNTADGKIKEAIRSLKKGYSKHSGDHTQSVKTLISRKYIPIKMSDDEIKKALCALDDFALGKYENALISVSYNSYDKSETYKEETIEFYFNLCEYKSMVYEIWLKIKGRLHE